MADDSAAMDEARAQAEARRKRILEKAQKRMDVVSGEQQQTETEKEESLSKAARIRAARQRRYGKKTPKDSTTETAADSESTPAATEDNTKSVETDDTPKPDDEAAAETKPTTESNDDTVPKKKYVGVARMRRNMLKKKKMEEDQTTDEATAASQVDMKNIKLRTSPKVPMTPVYMQMVTIVLLFLAGMDVGLQQNPFNGIVPHFQLAVNQHGLPLIHRSIKTAPEPESKLEELRDELISEEEQVPHSEFEEDEEEEKIPNIDPLFRIDLDQATAGPGLLNQLARGAVVVHRMIMYLFYFLPQTVIRTVIGIPRALMQSPPALCVIAVALRQLVGKTLLGAGIPEKEQEDNGGTVDVLAMVKKFVTQFFAASFPSAVRLYDAFSHLRADIYVLLCGVFTGLVLVHFNAQMPPIEETPSVTTEVYDEL